MLLQPVGLSLCLDLAQRVADHRQQPLGRQLIDKLRLAVAEAGRAQTVVQLGIGLDQRMRRRDLPHFRFRRDRGRLRRSVDHSNRLRPLSVTSTELSLQLAVGFEQGVQADGSFRLETSAAEASSGRVPVPLGLLDQLDLVHALREAQWRGKGHGVRAVRAPNEISRGPGGDQGPRRRGHARLAQADRCPGRSQGQQAALSDLG